MAIVRKAPTLPTVGGIAARLGVAAHQVTYVIDTRGLDPVGWAGNARVYSEADVEFIRSELARIERDKAGGQ